jgi:hypothetical protein
MTQYGEPHYRRGAATRMRIADGYCYNLGHRYQTFVKEFDIPDIRCLVPITQFRELRQLNVRVHHAFVFDDRVGVLWNDNQFRSSSTYMRPSGSLREDKAPSFSASCLIANFTSPLTAVPGPAHSSPCCPDVLVRATPPNLPC